MTIIHYLSIFRLLGLQTYFNNKMCILKTEEKGALFILKIH